jgi:hypothetical protein
MCNSNQLPYCLPVGTCKLCVHPWLIVTGNIRVGLSVGDKYRKIPDVDSGCCRPDGNFSERAADLCKHGELFFSSNNENFRSANIDCDVMSTTCECSGQLQSTPSCAVDIQNIFMV